MKAVSFLVAIAASWFPPSQTEGFEQQRSEAFQAFIAELEAHAKWCSQKRLFLERESVYELILDYDPDHAEARRALGYRLDPGAGAWIPTGDKKPATNKNDTALKEARSRLMKAHEHLVERLTKLRDAGGLTSSELDVLQRDILSFDPEVLEASESLGSTGRYGPDTVAAIRRREEIALLVRAAWDSAPVPMPVELDPTETALGLPLKGASTSELRVLTTGDVEEARHVARALEAAQELFRSITGADVSYPRGCRVFLLVGKGDKQVFLERHPQVTPELRAWLGTLEGAGVPGTGDWAFWEGDAEKRLDGMVRTGLDWLMREGFQLTVDQAWIHEGLGLYLTHALVGTRMTWFVNDSGIDPRKAFELRGRLRAPGLDWLEEARKVCSPEQDFALEDVLHRDTGELGAEDLLRAYALTAFIVEARAEDLVPVLKRLGAGEDPRAILEDEVERSLVELGQELARWLTEREHWLARDREKEAALTASWTGLDPAQKRAVIDDFRQRLVALDTLQLRLARAILEGTRSDQLPPLSERPYYDPKIHAPRDPIPRKRLTADDERVDDVLAQIEQKPLPGALRTSWSYDWASGTVERIGDPDDPETIFANALNGCSPEIDLACALVLKALDSGQEKKLLTAFSHAYTDRDGNVYPRITLYDAWLSGKVIEMPDVDVLGVLHDVLGEWERWTAPVPGSEHPALYAQVGELFQKARRYRQLRESLAECFLIARPAAREGYEGLQANLHAQWALVDSAPGSLAEVLPDGEKWELYIRALVKRCTDDPQMFRNGQKRLVQLEEDGKAVRAALIAALQGAGAKAR